jgi:signal recognition particle GTPase
LRFIGVGEQFDDLQVFDAGAFVDALLGIEAAADQP